MAVEKKGIIVINLLLLMSHVSNPPIKGAYTGKNLENQKKN